MARSSEVVRQWEILREIDGARNGITVGKLAAARGVCERTIRRDLDALARAGFPRALQHDLRTFVTAGMLPSSVELERSIVELFREQTDSGIWPKYFPLFHYQDAGSNFCFTFELLEAVLVEFGGIQNGLLSEDEVISGLERAVDWGENNRLKCSEPNSKGKVVPYEGWNSGGNLSTLWRRQPESWATAVVHMFLWELVHVLSQNIQHRLLKRYSAKSPTGKWKPLGKLLDIEIRLDRPAGLRQLLQESILTTFASYKGAESERLRRTPVKKAPLSALLFGPPGTSKTEVAKAIAAELNWALVEIDPSHFLQDKGTED